MSLAENSQFVINDQIIINDNILQIGNDNNISNQYEINFDVGIVFIYGEYYDIRLENSNVYVRNNLYLFGQYIFNISNNLVRCAGEVFHLNDFILKITQGRIKIKNKYHSFTVEDNIFNIGPFVKHVDLPVNTVNNDPYYNVFNKTYSNRFYDSYNTYSNNTIPPAPSLKYLANNSQNVHDNNMIPPAPSLTDLANNNQNVHDNYILAKLKNIIIDLLEKTKMTKTIKDTLYEIKKYNIRRQNKNKNFIIYYWNSIFSNYNKANEVIEYIENSNGFLPMFNMTELQVLQLVWNAIGNNDNLKEILYFNILDMKISDNHYVCLTGKITRMLDIFNGMEDNNIEKNIIINKDAIRNEMMTKCAKIRNTLSTDILYDDKLYKKEIKDRLYIDYVDSKILTDIEFNIEINEWIDHI